MKRFLWIFFLSISLQGFSQQRIFVTNANSGLISVDLANCTSHTIGSSGYGFGDIALTADGHLWGIVSSQLYRIDSSNANTTFIGNTGLDGVSLVELNDSTLLTESDMNLYGIRVSDASTYYIGYIGYKASGDLTWYDKDLYMTSGGFLIKIVLDQNNASIISSAPVNAATSPIPTCEGMVTAAFAGEFNAIVGFSGSDAYKICPIDGSFKLLCTSLVPDGTPGGAALRLPIQKPEPVACKDILAPADSTSIIISPNPANSIVTIQAPSVKFVYLIDAIGRRLTKGVEIIYTGPSSAQINTTGLAQAMYFIVIINNAGKRMAKKLLVIRP